MRIVVDHNFFAIFTIHKSDIITFIATQQRMISRMSAPKISVLIIDNEQEQINHAVGLLQKNLLISEVETVTNTDHAILKIINNDPDVILLNYPSKGSTEKELIEYVNTKLPETTLVLVAETKEYAAFAIQNGIFKYLLKPIKKEELEKIINIIHHTKQRHFQSRIDQIIGNSREEARFRLQTAKGYLMINPDELIFCKADGTYTELYMTGDRKELSSQFLVRFEEMLERYNFLRVSRSYLINQRFIRRVYRNNNTIVLFADGKEYEIKAGKAHIRKLSKFDTE